MAIQFGCLRLEQPTLRLLEEYKNRILSQLHESRKKAFDFDKPVFLVAAFHVQAYRMKVNVDKSKLLNAAAVSDRQFVRVKQSMLEVCFPSMVEQANEKKNRLKKQRMTRKKVPTGVIVKMRQKDTTAETEHKEESPELNSAETLANTSETAE